MQITHYTVNTGHGRLTDRSEVRDDVIDFLRPIVEAGGGELPMGFSVRIDRGDSGGWLFTVSVGTVPIVTCGLAMDEPQATEVWARLIGLATTLDLPRPANPPPVPWLSAVILPTAGAVADPGTMMAVADLERCVAWVLVDHDSVG